MKIYISYILYFLLLIPIGSCSQKKDNLEFSISYFQDFQESSTIESIANEKMNPLPNPRIGFRNGTYWFKVLLDKEAVNKQIVFALPESNIDEIAIYQNGQIVSCDNLEKTHFSLLVNSQSPNRTYYIKARFNNEVFFPLNVKIYRKAQIEEKDSFFIKGLYYGFVIMVLIVNLFFYFSLKDKSFLFYCFFLLSVTVVFFDFDGLLNTVLPSYFKSYDSLLIHFLIPFSGALFANHFLKIKSYLPKSNKIGILLLSVALSSYLLFIPTSKFLFIAIGDTVSLLVLLHYWVIGIVISRKNKFARFFVLGYSLVLFSAFLFTIPLDWGFYNYAPAASLNTLKLGSLFEMLILTYAITYRVNILQKENEQFKLEIQNYLNKINTLESNKDPAENLNIEDLISENGLSKREADVLFLISKGYTNSRIADELFISLNTVKYHIRNIYEKLNISSKNEAIDIISNI